MRKSKPPRDPNAPKRNMSAYLLYQNAMRDQFKAQNPGMTFGQLSKYTSVMYAQMSPVEKEACNARAEADKARYLHELSIYVPKAGFDSKGDAIMPPPVDFDKKGKRRKPDRDVNAPKRNVPAYLLYQNAMRNQFKAENPGMTFGQLSKYTSHMYKALTPDEKGVWEQKSLKDKARYQIEMSQYVPPPGHDAKGNIIVSALTEKKRRRKPPKDPLAPKRARGSYVFFTYDARPQILREYPDIKFIDLGHVMGERWRALTPEEKHQYEGLAKQDKIRFAQEMEKYKMNRAMEDAAAVHENAQLMYQQQMQQQQEQLFQHEYQQQQQQPQEYQQQLELQQQQQQQQQLELQQQQQLELQQQQMQQQEQLFQHEYQQQQQQPQEYQQQLELQQQQQQQQQLELQQQQQQQLELQQQQQQQQLELQQQQQQLELQQQQQQHEIQQQHGIQQQHEYQQQQQEYDPAQHEQMYASHITSHDDIHQYSVA
eukprot:CAMPEP_0194298110 /NCGR_PEP_ID=MMETSP0169-20130528/59981_1 /TAXON_ID=218684 /ORGANISM="Corethron pennatum, Strain L29A3" /LENGTH=482 /DNA_ID=CAMNT_0039048057 /DNA_START=550 /DNA_END=1998 /DNA_ORIENTATION=-